MPVDGVNLSNVRSYYVGSARVVSDDQRGVADVSDNHVRRCAIEIDITITSVASEASLDRVPDND